jgi:hypothetical protein
MKGSKRIVAVAAIALDLAFTPVTARLAAPLLSQLQFAALAASRTEDGTARIPRGMVVTSDGTANFVRIDPAAVTR